MQNQPEVDLPKFTKELLQIGLVACSAGFAQSAFKMFESLHQAFPDSHAPVMGMIYARLAQSRVKEGNDLLDDNVKLFVDVSDDHKIMKVFIEFFKMNGIQAIAIMQELQNSDNELTRDTVKNLMQIIGRS
jgi:hypothetical protein